MILVTNCAHDNGIYTYIDEAAGLVIKSSYSPEGMNRLDREWTGYEWYFDLVGLTGTSTLKLTKNRSRSYSRLKVSRFPGKTGNSYGKLSENRRDLLAAVAFYSRIWPRPPGGLAPMHGDFALGNLIMQPHGMVLIDWEHFHPEGAPWGFDLLNLLYESVAFSLAGKHSLAMDDRAAFLEVRRAIRRAMHPRDGLECSLDALTGFVSSHTSIWGGLVQKLPIMNLSPAQREFVKQFDRS